MGLFTKPRPIDRFNANYLQIKVMAFKLLKEYRPLVEKQIGKVDDDMYGVLIGRCSDYLLGEDHPQPGPQSSAETVRLYHEAYKLAPKLAPRILRIPVLDAFYAALIDYKDSKLTEILGTEWTESAEGKRVHKMISNSPKSIEDTDEYKGFWEDFNSLR